MSAHVVEIQKLGNNPHLGPRYLARCRTRGCIYVSPPSDIEGAKDAKAAHAREVWA